MRKNNPILLKPGWFYAGVEMTKELLEWWIKWSRIHRKTSIRTEDAEKEIAVLKDFVTALKNYHK